MMIETRGASVALERNFAPPDHVMSIFANHTQIDRGLGGPKNFVTTLDDANQACVARGIRE